MSHPSTDLHGPAFLVESIRLLEADYLPRVRRAIETLPPHDLWWRPNEASNSAGNLLLHMAGSLRQWVVSGVGGRPDQRQRSAEFEASSSPDAGQTPEPAHLLSALEEAVAEAVDVLRATAPARLADTLTVQAYDVTVLQAVYHAVEHFSMHTGQLLWIAKARAGSDLGLYGEGEDGHPRRLW